MVRKKRNLGPAFSDQVGKVFKKINHPSMVDEKGWTDYLLPNFDGGHGVRFHKSSWTVLSFAVVCLLAFFVIFLRLFHLQIIEGKSNKELAEGNRIQIRIIHAQRGVIFDRNGKILAANSPAFRLLDTGGERSSGLLSKKAKLISREEALEMEVTSDTELEIDNVRTYQLGAKFAHVIGYVGEISQSQLEGGEYKNYRLGDKIGQSGIEFQYEKLLRGKDGGEIVEVDSKGVRLRTLRRNPPIPGQNIYLTIEAALQEKIYEQLTQTLAKVGSCCGSAIAMDPQSGQILALVSLPSFDPNIFTTHYDENALSLLFSQKDSPILNRAIAGTYPPGSTFKIISALAALSSGITAEEEILDNGVIFLGSFKFTNWYFTQYGKTEGLVNLTKAIQRSNDIYFYEIGQRVGEERLAEWSYKLKLGNKLEIDLPGESSGLVPTDEWKRKTVGEGWYPGDTLHMAIGQGFVLTSPLQVLGMTSFIASDGVLYKPQLRLTNFKPKILVQNLVSQDKIKKIQAGLKLVPKNGGTAWPFFTFPLETAGKTGTAEFGDPKNRTHAWYTSYAPSDNPKIALTILVEGGGEGSSVAAPIAKEVYRWYFSADKNKLIQDVYTPVTDSGKE